MSLQYTSITANTSDSQGDITRNPETVTNTSNGNETVNLSSNGNFEQTLFSNQTIPILPPKMKPGIGQGIVPIELVPQMLLETATKEVVTDVESRGA